MKQKFCTLILISCISLVASAKNTADSLHWEGQSLREVISLGDVPVKIKTLLGVGNTGLQGIAERGDAFNATDAVVPSLPMRRFVVAGVGKNVSLVALEHGGYEYYVEVFLFSDINGTPVIKQKWILPPTIKHKWIIPYLPTTLKELLERIPNADRDDG